MRLIWGVTGLLTAAATWAAEPAATEAVELAPITVTATREGQAAFDLPQPVTVIDEQEIIRRAPQVMAEALRYEPGAFFQQTGPGQGIVIVRGLKGAEVLHLVDGMRLNNAFFRTAPSQYIALLDAQNIASLELLRGPYAALYGSDAMGGVVQVLTPEERFSEARLDYRAGARAAFGSADLARTGRAWGAVGDQRFSLSAGYSFSRYGERLLPEPGQSPDGLGGIRLEERVNDTDYLARGYDAKALWTPATGQELMASVQVFELPALPRYNETVPGFGNSMQSLSRAVYDNDRQFWHLRYRHTLSLGWVDAIELHLGRQQVNDDRRDRTLDRSRDTFEFNRSTLTGFTAALETRLGAHALRYGLDYYRDEVASRSMRETPPGSGNFTFNSAAGFQSRFPDGSTEDSLGLYLFDEWQAAERWLLTGGARWTRTSTDIAKADRALGAKLEDADVSGSLGTRFAITRGLAWTLNLGRGYRFPNVNDLAQTGRRSNDRVVVANLGLKPESIVSIDTGLKFASGALSGEAGVYLSRFRDRITLVSEAVPEGSGGCVDDGDALAEPCAQNRNVAEALYYGFESGLRYRLAATLELRAVLNTTFAQQEDGDGSKSPGNRVPPLNGQLAALWRPAPAWRVEPYLHFADEQDRLDATDLADNRIDSDGTPGYGVANLRVGWEPLSWLSLQADGRNLLDQSYREHGSGIDGAARGVVLSAEIQL